MARSIRLIVGLGNPGAEYEQTRHNIGFRVADAVASRARTEFDSHIANASVAEGRWRSRPFAVAKPLTFMNLSGRALKPLLRRFASKPSEALVIVDDINIPLGTVRIRPKGGDGGHNGLADIIEHLGTDAFPRMRIGVGKDFRTGDQSDYVLSPFDDEEFDVVEEMVDRATKAALTFVTDGVQTAMNRYNGASPAAGTPGEGTK